MAEKATAFEDNPFYGHLNHLDEHQEAALQQFKEVLISKKLYKPATDTSEASHDDATLLRFLRARRFVPQDACQQFEDTEKWRHAIDIKTLYAGLDVEEYEKAWSLYPQWLGRRDKRGIPLYLYKVSYLNSSRMAEYEKTAKRIRIVRPDGVEEKGEGTIEVPASGGNKVPPMSPKLLRLAGLYEGLLEFDLPLCNMLPRPNPEVPISQSNNIVDISNVGLKQFWDLRSHMQDASVMANAHYPETLDRIFIIGAPSFFNIVWSWIKKWFDKNTTDKIFILSPSEILPTLSEFIDIKNIPKIYGGELPFEFGDEPVLDDDINNLVEWEEGYKGFPLGSIVVKDLPDGQKEFVGIGSKDGKLRNIRIAKTKSLATKQEKTNPPEPESKLEKHEVSTAETNGAAKPSGEEQREKLPETETHANGSAIPASAETATS